MLYFLCLCPELIFLIFRNFILLLLVLQNWRSNIELIDNFGLEIYFFHKHLLKFLPHFAQFLFKRLLSLSSFLLKLILNSLKFLVDNINDFFLHFVSLNSQLCNFLISMSLYWHDTLVDRFYLCFYFLYLVTFQFQLLNLCKFDIHYFQVILCLKRDDIVDQSMYFLIILLHINVLDLFVLLQLFWLNTQFEFLFHFDNLPTILLPLNHKDIQHFLPILSLF